jgi:hypothetical protein
MAAHSAFWAARSREQQPEIFFSIPHWGIFSILTLLQSTKHSENRGQKWSKVLQIAAPVGRRTAIWDTVALGAPKRGIHAASVMQRL